MTWLVTLLLLLQPVICTLILGTGVTLWFWREVPKSGPERVMFASVLTLAGFGLSGILFFVWLNLAPDSFAVLRVIDMVAMGLGVLLIRARTKPMREARAKEKALLAQRASDGSGDSPKPATTSGGPGRVSEPPDSSPITPDPQGAKTRPRPPETIGPAPDACPPKWLVIAFMIAIFIALLASLTHFAHNPHGDFDAISMWNARARYVYIDPVHWHHAFDYGVHSDYPLLFPLTIARLWLYAGDTSFIVPQGIALATVTLTFLMLGATIARVRGNSSGHLAILATMTLPLFILQGAIQYADAPTMMLTLAALCMLVWSTVWSTQMIPIACGFAGLMAGINANIKNEGGLIFIGIAIGTFLVTLRSRSMVVVLKSLISFLAGAAVFLVFLWLCKSQIQGENDVISAHSKELMRSQLLDPKHHLTIWSNVLALIFLNRLYFNPQNAANFAAWIVPVWVVIDWCRARFAGWRPGPERLAMWAIFYSVGCVVAGYYAVYLITPYDLDWHLRTSCARLFLHLWPSVVLWAFLLLPPQLVEEKAKATQ